MKKFMLVALGITLLAGCTPTPAKEQAKAGAVSKVAEEVVTSVAESIAGEEEEEDTEVENPTLSDAAKQAVEESIKAVQEGGENLAAEVVVAEEAFTEIPINPENGLAANQLSIDGTVLTFPITFEEAKAALSSWDVIDQKLAYPGENASIAPMFYIINEEHDNGTYESMMGTKLSIGPLWKESPVEVDGFHKVTLGEPIVAGEGEAVDAYSEPFINGIIGRDAAVYWPIMQMEDGSWMLEVVYVVEDLAVGRGIHVKKWLEGTPLEWSANE